MDSNTNELHNNAENPKITGKIGKDWIGEQKMVWVVSALVVSP